MVTAFYDGLISANLFFIECEIVNQLYSSRTVLWGDKVTNAGVHWYTFNDCPLIASMDPMRVWLWPIVTYTPRREMRVARFS